MNSLEVLRALSNAGKAFFRSADRNLAAIGLSFRELQALMMLVESGPVPMVDLANEMMITQAGTTSVVDRLERNGLVERIRNKKDRRVINITITDKGRKTFKRALGVYKNFLDRSFGLLTVRERNYLVTTLDKIRRGTEMARVGEEKVITAAGKNSRRQSERA